MICSQFEKRIFAIYGNSEKVNAMSTKHMGIWVGLISSITLLVASVASAETEDAIRSGTTVFFGEDAPERYGLPDLTHSYNFIDRDDWVDNSNLNRLGLDGLPAVGALMEEMPGHHEVYGLVQVATSWKGVNRDSGSCCLSEGPQPSTKQRCPSGCPGTARSPEMKNEWPGTRHRTPAAVPPGSSVSGLCAPGD